MSQREVAREVRCSTMTVNNVKKGLDATVQNAPVAENVHPAPEDTQPSRGFTQQFMADNTTPPAAPLTKDLRDGIDAKRDEKIKEPSSAGMSLREVAKHVGCSKDTVDAVKKRVEGSVGNERVVETRHPAP